MKQTNTHNIFSSAAPYANSYQTTAKRLLFVCSVGMLRSPTAQMVASQNGHNARACGSDVEVALIPLSCNLINWADKIIFMNPDNFEQAKQVFDSVGYKEDIEAKAIVWNIVDDYSWYDDVLWNILYTKMKMFD